MYTNVIYIDILLVINFYVSFFLIKASDVVLHRRTKRLRILLGVCAGGITSLVALFPALNSAISLIIKLISCLIIAFIIYGFELKKGYIFLKNTLIFLIVNFIFAGIMMFLWNFLTPAGMVYNNGYIYFNVSFAFITVSSCIAYAVIKIFRYIMDVKFTSDKKYMIILRNNNNSVTLSAFADSGNTLTDFFTGLPVIICNSKKCEVILPDNMINFDYENYTGDISGIRVIPYSTIDSSGFIPVFKPEYVEINSKPIVALIGVTSKNIGGEVDAVFNPKLLI